MKKIIFLKSFLLTFLIILTACSTNTNKVSNPNIQKSDKQSIKTGYFTIDTLNSNVEWIGKKTTGAHNGDIQIKQGKITTNEQGNINQGKFILNMESINCTDLKGKKKASIEEHLKDPDFFDTKKHPEASFTINKVENNTIFGILTIKGISQNISFDFEEIGELTYKAEIIVDRTLFDIKYKSKTIFPDLGDHFIYDDFTISLNPIIFK